MFLVFMFCIEFSNMINSLTGFSNSIVSWPGFHNPVSFPGKDFQIWYMQREYRKGEKNVKIWELHGLVNVEDTIIITTYFSF